LKKKYVQNPEDTHLLFDLALAHLNISLYEDSIKLWERFIELIPRDSIAYNNLGVCHLYLKKYKYAKLVLQKAYRIDSTASSVIFNLGCFYRLQGDIKKALHFYREYNEDKPGNPFIEYFLEKYSSLPEIQKGEDEDKIPKEEREEQLPFRDDSGDQSLLKTVMPASIKKSLPEKTPELPLSTGDTASLLEAIFITYENKNQDEAFNLLSRLDLSEVTNHEHRVRLAKILSALGSKKHKEEKHMEALKCYKDAFGFNSNLPLKGKIGQQYFKAGEKFYAEGSIDRAVESFESALEWDRGSPARNLLIKALTVKAEKTIETKSPEDACELLKRIVELEPDNEFARSTIKECSLKIPERAEKEDILSSPEDIKEDASEEKIEFLLTPSEEVREDIVEEKTEPLPAPSEEVKEKTADKKKEKPECAPPKILDKKKKSSLTGIILVIAGIFLIAVITRYFMENFGQEARERNAENYYYKGLEAEREGELDRAIALFRKAVSLNPSYAEAHNHLGQAYDRKGEPTEALKAFETAKNNNLNYAAAYDNLALMSQKCGDELNAGVYRELAREKYNLKNRLIKEFLSHYSNNETIIAIEKLMTAITIDPEDPALYYNLALTYIREGNFDDAEKNLKKAIKIAQARENRDYVDKFSFVLSNIRSEDLVLEIISYDGSSEGTPVPKETPAGTTATPVAETTPLPSPSEEPSLPSSNEDPQVAAVDTTSMFFQCLNNKDYDQAYSLLSSGWQKEVSAGNFAAGFSDINRFNVSSIRITETTDTSISVKVYFTALKNKEDGSYLGAYEGIYKLVWQGQSWRIDQGDIDEKTLEGQDDTTTF